MMLNNDPLTLSMGHPLKSRISQLTARPSGTLAKAATLALIAAGTALAAPADTPKAEPEPAESVVLTAEERAELQRVFQQLADTQGELQIVIKDAEGVLSDPQGDMTLDLVSAMSIDLDTAEIDLAQANGDLANGHAELQKAMKACLEAGVERTGETDGTVSLRCEPDAP